MTLIMAVAVNQMMKKSIITTKAIADANPNI